MKREEQEVLRMKKKRESEVNFLVKTGREQPKIDREEKKTTRRLDLYGKKGKFIDGSVYCITIHIMQIGRFIPLLLAQWYNMQTLLNGDIRSSSLKYLTLRDMALFYRVTKRLILSELTDDIRERIKLLWAFHELRDASICVERTRAQEIVKCYPIIVEDMCTVTTKEQLQLVKNYSAYGFRAYLTDLYFPTLRKGVHYVDIEGGWGQGNYMLRHVNTNLVDKLYSHLRVIRIDIECLKSKNTIYQKKYHLNKRVAATRIIQRAWREYMYHPDSVFIQKKSELYTTLEEQEVILENVKISRGMFTKNRMWGTTTIKPLVDYEIEEIEIE